MQIVIEIDENTYKARQHWVTNPKRMVNQVDVAIANGIVLPSGHGRLVDVKEILDAYENAYKGTRLGDLEAFLSDYVQTVVPADLVNDSQGLVSGKYRWITDEELDDIIYDAFVTTDIDAIAEMQEAYAERKRNEC